jgi:asparagine synthase (glutamine-hydrolysing)
MCGIAGVVRFARDAQVDPVILRRMCAAMVHRGPDDEGIYFHGRAGLGVRRLSIIDLKTGHQPIGNEDGTHWIVFNGEIYNHLALRQQLIECGHRYRTDSDTETILHLYEEYGRDCVNHLRGMFAFAIWDSHKERLFIARDRLGIKPLYYRMNPEGFVFGSEIKVILAHPGIGPEFNREVLAEYLAFGYVSGPETFFSGIHKLMPGHILELEADGKHRIDRYWDLPSPVPETHRTETYYIETYRDLLDQALESHLMSDVPLGVFLSGGLDSSAVAALATKIRRMPVETFSVGYAESTFSELPRARQVAKHLKSIHHEVLVSSEDFFNTLPKLIWHEDEPIAWPSSVALYFVARLAREHVTVVLTGEGSDETLAGYTRYAFSLKNAALDRLYRRVTPRSARQKLRQLIADSGLINATMRRKLTHTFLGRDGNSWTSFYFDNFYSAFAQVDQAELLPDDAAEQLTHDAAYRRVMEYWEASSGGLLRRMLYTDIKTYLVELLMKQDNMSMAASVESRIPFLDHTLVEFAMGIPQNFQVRGLGGKRILKKAVAELLPDSVINQRKLGFPTPWSAWLAGPRLNTIRNLLLEERSIDRGLFEQASVERLFHEHLTGCRDHADRIWRLLNLELWFQVCLEGESHDSALIGSAAAKSIATV